MLNLHNAPLPARIVFRWIITVDTTHQPVRPTRDQVTYSVAFSSSRISSELGADRPLQDIEGRKHCSGRERQGRQNADRRSQHSKTGLSAQLVPGGPHANVQQRIIIPVKFFSDLKLITQSDMKL